jgi:hypothetical protein
MEPVHELAVVAIEAASTRRRANSRTRIGASEHPEHQRRNARKGRHGAQEGQQEDERRIFDTT